MNENLLIAYVSPSKAQDIKVTQQNDARIRILQNEIACERSISTKENARVHELERQVSDLTDERDTFKDLYNNASIQQQNDTQQSPRTPLKAPDSPVS